MSKRSIRKNRHLKESIINWKPPEPTCSNCGRNGSHFVGPSFGEAGFFACEAQ